MTKEDAKELFKDYDLTEAIKNDEPHDIISEIADAQVDIYTSDLLAWVEDNYQFIEDAIDEFGFPKDDEGKPDFIKAIIQGQYYEAEQVLWEAWEDVKKGGKNI